MQCVATFGSQPALDVAEGRHAIGIDVGGTKIAGGIVDLATGRVTARAQMPTDIARGGAPVRDDVVEMALQLMATAQTLGLAPAAVGVGVAELVDLSGTVASDYRIKWRGLDVQGRLAARMNELVPGCAVVLSSGVSGVLVQQGRPYAGSNGAALVIANGPVTAACPHCGKVSRHTVEDIASGPAIADAFAPGSRAEDVLVAAAAGDPHAIAVIDHATQALGQVLALLVNALDPSRLVIGGGLGSAAGPYFASLKGAIRAGRWEGYRRDLPILQAALGPDAGLIGAAAATVHTQEPANRPMLPL